MAANIKNVIRGDSKTINVTVKNAGAAVDITGWTVYFTLSADRDPASDTTAAIQKNVTSHTSPTTGQTQIVLSAADTAALTPGTYFYDIQFKDGSGTVTSLPQAEFIVVPDITRRTS